MMTIFMTGIIIVAHHHSKLIDVEYCLCPSISVWLEHAFICAITTFIRLKHMQTLQRLITLVQEAFTLFLNGEAPLESKRQSPS